MPKFRRVPKYRLLLSRLTRQNPFKIALSPLAKYSYSLLFSIEFIGHGNALINAGEVNRKSCSESQLTSKKGKARSR
ncbi:hypothetical protein SBA2_370017 [Acidobacteriia bacterium SbA2]|nr:hypothetical protein SBA2_370017 [Acidobacteriia bacterium SbA2]